MIMLLIDRFVDSHAEYRGRSFRGGPGGHLLPGRRRPEAGTLGVVTSGSGEPVRPRLELMTRFNVALGRDPWTVGATSDLGTRRIVPITGGSFAGPMLNGVILDNGADWQVITRDGLTLIDTRYLLRLDDGELAYLRTSGYRHGPPEVLAALAAGDDVDPARYYFRVHLDFETASAGYSWLNRCVAVGSAVRQARAVVYDAYRVT